MSNDLYVWYEDKLVAHFERRGRQVTLTYEPAATWPISLSLPLSGNWHPDAPMNFLRGLLPEDASMLLRLRCAVQAPSDDPFDLLDKVDTAGAFTFSTSPVPPQAKDAFLAVMTKDDIVGQIVRCRTKQAPWLDRSDFSRYTLAGVQGKFTVIVRHGRWYWPHDVIPSTHIVKPEVFRDVSAVEHATMSLARAIGLDVPATQVITFDGEPALVIERFDRSVDKYGIPHRRHIEDFTQALGMSAKDKYELTIPETVNALRKAGAPEQFFYNWIKQVAFNNAIGNGDAHGKNYSLYLDDDVPRLCPLYDSICMSHWEELKYDTLAIPVNDVYDPWCVTLDDWIADAEASALDPQRVADIVCSIERDLLSFDYSRLDVAPTIQAELRDYVHECARDLLPSLDERRQARETGER